MSRSEIKSKNPAVAAYSKIGMRAGQFLFFGTQTPHDLASGRLVKGFADVPEDARKKLSGLCSMVMIVVTEERILAQAWQILTNMQELLAAHGSSLDQVVRQRFFLRDMRDATYLEHAIRLFMPGSRPATTILGATNDGVNEDIAVVADFIAIDSSSGLRRENVSVPAIDHLTAPYPLASRAGQFIFTSQIAGIDAATGRPVQDFGALTAAERELLEPPYTPEEETAVAQHAVIFRHMREILKSQGAPLGSHIHQNTWLQIPMQAFGPVAKLRARLFAGSGNQAVSTALPISRLRRHDAIQEVAILALVPPGQHGSHRKVNPMAVHPLSGFYLPVVKAGPYALTAGEVGIDTSVPRFMGRYSDLGDEGRFLPYGRVHEEKQVTVEAWWVYKKLETYLKASGMTMDDVVHQSVFMTQPAEFPALERIAEQFFGPKLPPTSLVPIKGTTPYPQATLEIEVIATPA